MEPDRLDAERLYRALRRIRRVEEAIARIYPSDAIKSPVHLSIGQEAVAVGICDVLAPSDVVSGSYRGHASYLAKGGDLRAMMAELYGKATGCAGGKGGSMHLVDMAHGVLGSSAVVGTTIPVAVGYALALAREGGGRVVVAFFGDGATEEGCFYESLNFAKLHRLPVLFVCENNGYAIHAPIERRWACPDLEARVRGFDIDFERDDGTDVLALRTRAAALVASLREPGRGPAFIECRCYRWREHVGPSEDYDDGYRTRTELEPWQTGDQVEALAGRLDADRRDRIDAAIEAEIEDAVEFARTSPVPAPGALLADVHAG